MLSLSWFKIVAIAGDNHSFTFVKFIILLYYV